MANANEAITNYILEAMDTAAKKGQNRFENAEIQIRHMGTKIILPSDPHQMRTDEAILCLQRKQKEEEEEISVHEQINAFPFDGAYAFMNAMKDTYGWASPIPTETFFGKVPPTTINLEIEHGVHTQIIWGKFAVPGIEGYLETGSSMKDDRPIFTIKGKVKKKHQNEVAQLAQKTREFVGSNSIYKGKAITLKTDDKGKVDWSSPPKFIDLSRVNPDELTFSEEVGAQVQTNLFNPIEYTAACRMHHIPLKRGILLEGPFGTGKTLTAFVAALKARANGWTFILIDRVGGLKEALTFARMYQPAVVSAEDVDRAVSGQERTVAMDDILNTIDGVESKGSEVITILTSNDVTQINRAMIRPGRLDAIISVQAPDAKAAEKLVRIYARGLIQHDEDLSSASVELAGQIPAVIREVVERSKLYAIGRAKNGDIKLKSDDLAHDARGMKHHLALLNPSKETPPTIHEALGLAMSKVIDHSVQTQDKIHKIVEEIQESM